MKRKKRVIIVVSSIVASLCLVYFLGGYVAALCVQNALLGKRQSEVGDLSQFCSLVDKTRDDYPSLKARKEVTFSSSGQELQGYFYQYPDPKGTFVFAHGLKGYADDQSAAVQDALYRSGYSVFAFDLSSSGRSQGNGISSLAQGAYDVKAAMEYLFSENDFYAPLSDLYLCGYSWGAYSVSASLRFAYPSPIKGILSFSGFDTPQGEMLALARNYVGGLADFTSLTFEWAMNTKAGQDRLLSAGEGISSAHVKAVLIHGEEDRTVPLSASLYQALPESGTVKKILRPGYSHSLPWLSLEAKAAREELQEAFSSEGEEAFRAKLSQEGIDAANRIDEALIQEALAFLEEE